MWVRRVFPAAQLVKGAPDFNGYLGPGLTQLRLEDLNAAIPSLKRALELNPQLPGVNLFLGIAQYQKGRASEATDSLKAELATSPTGGNP